MRYNNDINIIIIIIILIHIIPIKSFIQTRIKTKNKSIIPTASPLPPTFPLPPPTLLLSKPQSSDVIYPSSQSFNLTTVAYQFEAFKTMSLPYFTSTKQGKIAFATVVVLTLLNSGVSVAFSYVGRDFYSALSSKDPEQFNSMLVKFSTALTAGVPVSVLYRYQREKLSLEWREWMTSRVLELYFTNGVYYGVERGGVVDNPDQRIAEDVKTFTAFSLTLFITAVTSVIDLASFSAILYSIKPSLFVDILAYALFGTVTTSYIGRRLGGLNFEQLKKEADFRYALVRVRENAEGVAFYEGDKVEGEEVNKRLRRAVENTGEVIRAQRNLEFFTTAYRYLIQGKGTC